MIAAAASSGSLSRRRAAGPATTRRQAPPVNYPARLRGTRRSFSGTTSPRAAAFRPFLTCARSPGFESTASVSSSPSRSSGLSSTAAGRPLRVTMTRSCCSETRSTSSDRCALTVASGSVSDMTTIIVIIPCHVLGPRRGAPARPRFQTSSPLRNPGDSQPVLELRFEALIENRFGDPQFFGVFLLFSLPRAARPCPSRPPVGAFPGNGCFGQGGFALRAAAGGQLSSSRRRWRRRSFTPLPPGSSAALSLTVTWFTPATGCAVSVRPRAPSCSQSPWAGSLSPLVAMQRRDAAAERRTDGPDPPVNRANRLRYPLKKPAARRRRALAAELALRTGDLSTRLEAGTAVDGRSVQAPICRGAHGVPA